MPDNPAGKGNNTENKATNKTGDGVEHATCIKLTGEALQDGVLYNDVVFTLYPGNGNNDYNIVRNGLYTINITLTGIDFSDKRVTVGACSTPSPVLLVALFSVLFPFPAGFSGIYQ